MSQPFVGQVIAVGFNFAPLGWALCNGQLLQIADNTALYQLLGTTYGGDGSTTFGVPDLRSRVVVGAGQGQGLQNYIPGQLAGSEEVTLTSGQIAAHSHTLMSTTSTASTAAPGPTVVPAATAPTEDIYSNAGANTA